MMHCLSDEAVSYVDCMEALPSGYQSAGSEQPVVVRAMASAPESARARVKSSVNVRGVCRVHRAFIVYLQL